MRKYISVVLTCEGKNYELELKSCVRRRWLLTHLRRLQFQFVSGKNADTVVMKYVDSIRFHLFGKDKEKASNIEALQALDKPGHKRYVVILSTSPTVLEILQNHKMVKPLVSSELECPTDNPFDIAASRYGYNLA